MPENLQGAYYAVGVYKYTANTAVHWEAKEFKAPFFFFSRNPPLFSAECQL